VAAGEGLPALGDDVRQPGAVELGLAEGVLGDLAVGPTPVHKVWSKPAQ